MAGDILVIKKRGQKISLKITKRMRSGYCPDNNTIVINLKDFRDVSLLLHDLKDLYNVNIDRAILEYQKPRNKTWPF